MGSSGKGRLALGNCSMRFWHYKNIGLLRGGIQRQDLRKGRGVMQSGTRNGREAGGRRQVESPVFRVPNLRVSCVEGF